MIGFKSFLSEATIRATGMDALRMHGKYIEPYLKGNSKHDATGTHTLAAGHARAGEKVSLIGHSIKDNVSHVTVQYPGTNKKEVIPVNKLNKPFTQQNKGLAQEATLAKTLNKHGLMKGSGAGSTGGNDFHLIDKRTAKANIIQGTEGHPNEIQGEHKSDLRTTAFGQITLSRHPETGLWHIDDKARGNRPEYARAVEAATVTQGGKTRTILDHLNKFEPKGHVPATKTGIKSDETDLHPAHAYMRDHHTDVLHIDSHGTYRAGLSQHKDRHKLGLPALQGGRGSFRIRQKTANVNKRTVQFSIHSVPKSDVHLGQQEHIEKLKKVLGHSQ
jgi:hypothetical protein